MCVDNWRRRDRKEMMLLSVRLQLEKDQLGAKLAGVGSVPLVFLEVQAKSYTDQVLAEFIYQSLLNLKFPFKNIVGMISDKSYNITNVFQALVSNTFASTPNFTIKPDVLVDYS